MKSVNSGESNATPMSAKKLKQATLPFFAVTNKNKNSTNENSKKRKKKDSESDDIQVLKVICNDNNTDNTVTPAPILDMSNELKDDGKREEVCEPKSDVSSPKVVIAKTEIKENDLSQNKPDELKDDKHAESSSPLPLLDSSVDDDDTSPNDSMEVDDANNTSMNVSALLDGDDKDSVISLSDIPLTPMKIPSSGAKKPRKLTPKQIQKQEEMQQRRAEKEREKEERERKKQEEKDNKKRQKEEKEEQKKKERLEREKKRQAEIDQKLEEKRLKEEDRRRKEDEKVQEKRRKEEEKIQREEEKKKAEEDALKKKEKAAAAFASFFVCKRSDSKSTAPVEEVAPVRRNFMPFEVKVGMRLAPTTRGTLDVDRRNILDTALEFAVSNNKLYLENIKAPGFKPGCQGKTWPYSDIKNEVMIIDEEIPAGQAIQLAETSSKRTVRAKLLQFHENQRPPYWGTWRKKSQFVGPRRPLGMDKVQFDYEVDSEEEWEEEEPGESIKGSEDEQEQESDDEYEVDNEFFVPHGYLSDEEAGQDEAIPPEAQKERLKMLENEFNAEMKLKKQQLKPRILGIFLLNNSEKKDPVYQQLLSILKPYTALRIPSAIPTTFTQPSEPSTSEKSANSISKRGAKRRNIPEEAVPYLIRLIHGNTKSQNFLCKEFIAYWQATHSADTKQEEDVEGSTQKPQLLSRANTLRKLKELAAWQACPDEGDLKGKFCWYIPLEVRQAYGLTDLTTPNTWKYTLSRGNKRKVEDVNLEEKPEPPSKASTSKSTPGLITKFAKKMSDEERKQQIKRKSTTPLATVAPKVKPLPASPFSPTSAFSVSPSTQMKFGQPKAAAPTNNVNGKQGRRVSILVSVPRGQEIPIQASGIKNFLVKPNATESSGTENSGQKATVDSGNVDETKQEGKNVTTCSNVDSTATATTKSTSDKPGVNEVEDMESSAGC